MLQTTLNLSNKRPRRLNSVRSRCTLRILIELFEAPPHSGQEQRGHGNVTSRACAIFVSPSLAAGVSRRAGTACLCSCIGTRREAHVSSHGAARGSRGSLVCSVRRQSRGLRAQYDQQPCSACAIHLSSISRWTNERARAHRHITTAMLSARARTANPPCRACRRVASLLLRVWRRTGQPHSAVRGSILRPSQHGQGARALALCSPGGCSALDWRALCKPSPARPRALLSGWSRARGWMGRGGEEGSRAEQSSAECAVTGRSAHATAAAAAGLEVSPSSPSCLSHGGKARDSCFCLIHSWPATTTTTTTTLLPPPLSSSFPRCICTCVCRCSALPAPAQTAAVSTCAPFSSAHLSHAHTHTPICRPSPVTWQCTREVAGASRCSPAVPSLSLSAPAKLVCSQLDCP